MESVPLTRAHARRAQDLEPSRREYERALVEGSREAASAAIEELLSRRCSLGEIYAKVITPALASIGDLWCRAELMVADEHLTNRSAVGADEPTADYSRRTGNHESPGFTKLRRSCVVARNAVGGLEIALKFLRAHRPKVILKEYLLALGRRARPAFEERLDPGAVG
jgi:hypothetical protein